MLFGNEFNFVGISSSPNIRHLFGLLMPMHHKQVDGLSFMVVVLSSADGYSTLYVDR